MKYKIPDHTPWQKSNNKIPLLQNQKILNNKVLKLSQKFLQSEKEQLKRKK